MEENEIEETKKREIFLSSDRLKLVKQNALLDAENFVQSRSDENTLKLIGAAGNNYSIETVSEGMKQHIHDSFYENSKIVWTILNENNNYIGDVRLIHRDRDTYEIGIVIIPEYQRNKYGTEVTELLSSFLKNNGVKNLLSRIYENNPVSKEFFESLGSKFISQKDDNYIVDDINYPENTYSKEL